jgi:hypothetical protein
VRSVAPADAQLLMTDGSVGSTGFAGLPPRAPEHGFRARNPLVVDDYAGARRVLDWLKLSAADLPMRATSVHVTDTRLVYQHAAFGGLTPVQACQDAEADGEQLLATLRTAAPNNVSVTTRLFVAPVSRARQVLRAVDELSSCDALVISTPVRRSLFDATARMCHCLRRRSPVPLLVPVASSTADLGRA